VCACRVLLCRPRSRGADRILAIGDAAVSLPSCDPRVAGAFMFHFLLSMSCTAFALYTTSNCNVQEQLRLHFSLQFLSRFGARLARMDMRDRRHTLRLIAETRLTWHTKPNQKVPPSPKPRGTTLAILAATIWQHVATRLPLQPQAARFSLSSQAP
jgi:hypothetical protein